MWRDLLISWFSLLNLQGLCKLGALESHKPHAAHFRKDSVIAHHTLWREAESGRCGVQAIAGPTQQTNNMVLYWTVPCGRAVYLIQEKRFALPWLSLSRHTHASQLHGLACIRGYWFSLHLI